MYSGRLGSTIAVFSKEPEVLETKMCGKISATVSSNTNYRRVHITQWSVSSLILLSHMKHTLPFATPETRKVKRKLTKTYQK